MIVIPMAGLSKRFLDAGYKLPKYMLPLGSKTVFDHAIESFRDVFEQMPFLFIARDVHDSLNFISNSCQALGVRDARIVILSEPTTGQAETVELGLRRLGTLNHEPITIFNIDTFRPNFTFPTEAWWHSSDGYLEVFRGTGVNWSYVRPSNDDDGRVLETAEKQPISDLCCTGLYHFRMAGDFLEALALERLKPSMTELYVAPLYNHLIAGGRRISFRLVGLNDVIFCGIPSEYESLCESSREKLNG